MRKYGVAFLVFMLIAGGAAAAGFHYLDTELHGARRPGMAAVAVDIPQGTSVSGIAEILRRAGVIDSPTVFELYVRFKGLASQLEAGSYEVPGGLSAVQVIALLEHNTGGSQLSLTIPEGLTAEQVAGLAEKKGLFSAAAYLQEVRAGTFAMPFLGDRPPGADLQGFLFPDTYFLGRGATAHDLVTFQLKRFAERVPATLRNQSADQHLTFYQSLVMASIIEREARFDADRPQVAAVFYNRLARHMPLGADATLLFARGATSGSVTPEDKQSASPYNTYLNVGLPPGPICNPGLPSIVAALAPSHSDFLYYVTDTGGHAHFARTFQEHQQNIVTYGVH